MFFGTLNNSLALSEVGGGSSVGGLVGYRHNGTISNSYWNTNISSTGIGREDGEQDVTASGQTTSQLQSPTGYTGIYSTWAGDPDSTGDDYWHFGTSSQYPVLIADFNDDGNATHQEFGNQHGYYPSGPSPMPTPPATPPTVQPQPPGTGERYASLSSGAGHVCLLRDDGAIDCGGDNSHGQALPPTTGRYLSVDNGDTFSCAVREDGAVVCWGSIAGIFTTSNPPPVGTSSPSDPTPLPPTPTVGATPSVDPCVVALPGSANITDNWDSTCNSFHRAGRHSRFYTFTLGDSREVTITLESSNADTYLNLLSGAGRDGSVLHSNDDDGSSSRSRIQTTLAAGTYTVEATTYDAGETGDFTLSLSIAADGGQASSSYLEASSLAADPCLETLANDGTVSGEWSSGCVSANQSGSYSRYYTFTLSALDEVTINLESDVDTVLFLLSGDGMEGEVIAENDDIEDGDTNSRIQGALGAGTYTIEATTYDSGETGGFTLSISGL